MRISLYIAIILTAILAASFIPETNALVERIYVIDYKPEWFFLTKFSFYNGGQEAPGVLSVKVNPNFADTTGVKLVFYDDEAFSFPTLKRNFDSLTCEQKITLTDFNGTAKNVISLQEFPTFSVNITNYIEHFWYFAIATCGRNSSITELEFTMTLENPGGFFRTQFSMDQWGLLEIHLVFVILLSAMGVIYGVGIFKYLRAKALHLIVQIFGVALYSYLLGVFFVWVHLMKFASDGYGVGGLEGLGIVFKTVAEVVLIFLLLLIAQGWTITKPVLEHKRIIAGVFITIFVLYAVLFIWAQVGVDPSDYLYLYDTPPGIILNILRLPLLGFFIYSIVQTYKLEQEEKKRFFYKVFAGAYSAWFLVLPIIAIIAALAYQSTVAWRMYSPSIVEAMSTIAFTVSLGGLMFLLWPSRVNEIFHITQGASGLTPYDQL